MKSKGKSEPNLRIEAGFLKGTRLKSPKGLETRPTTGKVRSAVFDSLRDSLHGATFLDLFAGSGVNGLEALSRGASHATFLEYNSAAMKVLSSNIKELEERGRNIPQLSTSTEIIKADLRRGLNGLDSVGKFSLVWMDPPYSLANDFVESIIPCLPTYLEDGATLILETSSDDGSSVDLLREFSLEMCWSRRYGKTKVEMYKAN